MLIYYSQEELVMKYIVPLFIVILLIACTSIVDDGKAEKLAEQLREQAAEAAKEKVKETVKEVPKEEPEEEVKEVPKAEPKVEVSKVGEVEEETLSPSEKRTKMYRFLDTFAEKVKGYEFIYKKDKYFVRGKKYKIILENPVTVKHVTFGDLEKNLFYYDTIYLDRSSKKAVAYCEGHDSRMNYQCSDLEIRDLGLPVEYTDFNITLPEDWLFAYLDYEPDVLEENKYYIEGRASVYVRFEGATDLELNFDRGSGLVMRVDRKKSGQLLERIDYENLVSNDVREVDVIHRSKDEIPSEEVFYR